MTVETTSTKHPQTPQRLHRTSETILNVFANVASAILGFEISFLLGVQGPGTLPPVFQNHVVLFLTLVVLLAVVIGSSLLVSRQIGGRDWAKHLGANAVVFLARNALTTLGTTILGLIFGFNSFSSSIPLLDQLRHSTPIGLIIIAILLLPIILSPLISYAVEAPHSTNELEAGIEQKERSRLVASTLISLASTILFVALFTVDVVHPAWCPSAICPVVIAAPSNGVHDDNLNLSYVGIQSLFSLLPGDENPSAIDPQKIDQRQAAVELNTPEPLPYTARVEVQSRLRNTDTAIIIKAVDLVMLSADPAPSPALVVQNSTLGQIDFAHGQGYDGRYIGQRAMGIIETATTIGVEQLAPGDGAELDISLASTKSVALRFYIRIEYRIATASDTHMLDLTPFPFIVTFVPPTDWQAYSNCQGHLAPGQCP